MFKFVFINQYIFLSISASLPNCDFRISILFSKICSNLCNNLTSRFSASDRPINLLKRHIKSSMLSLGLNPTIFKPIYNIDPKIFNPIRKIGLIKIYENENEKNIVYKIKLRSYSITQLIYLSDLIKNLFDKVMKDNPDLYNGELVELIDKSSEYFTIDV